MQIAVSRGALDDAVEAIELIRLRQSEFLAPSRGCAMVRSWISG
jgi:hypothetical protein